MPKRANGEGSIWERNDGRWCASVVANRGRRYVYGRTRGEVARKLTAMLKRRDDGLPLPPERDTIASFTRAWLDGLRGKIRPQTWATYEQYLRLHVNPLIGSVPLARLTPAHLTRLYQDRLDAGLSTSTVHHIHAVIHTALEQALRWELVGRNVAHLVDAPQLRHLEMHTFTGDEARRFLDAVRGDRLEALYVLALTTGMRRGELCALRWRDVDVERATLSVTGTLLRRPGASTIVAEPKTKRSRRRIELSQAAIAALRRHRSAQVEDRLKAGIEWVDGDFVFTTALGSPLHPGNVLRRSFWPILANAALPRIRFHDLRHSAATLMLEAGIHPKVVSEMLGHSTVGITLDLYSHVTPTMQRVAARAIDALIDGR